MQRSRGGQKCLMGQCSGSAGRQEASQPDVSWDRGVCSLASQHFFFLELIKFHLMFEGSVFLCLLKVGKAFLEERTECIGFIPMTPGIKLVMMGKCYRTSKEIGKTNFWHWSCHSEKG